MMRDGQEAGNPGHRRRGAVLTLVRSVWCRVGVCGSEPRPVWNFDEAPDEQQTARRQLTRHAVWANHSALFSRLSRIPNILRLFSADEAAKSDLRQQRLPPQNYPSNPSKKRIRIFCMPVILPIVGSWHFEPRTDSDSPSYRLAEYAASPSKAK